MDAQSIITQVGRDDELGRAVQQPPPEKATKKKSRKGSGVLNKFFCCFRPHASVHQHTPVPTNEDGCIVKPNASQLLSVIDPKDAHKKCVVIDLDETLVHSSFQPINNADFIIPVEIDGTVHQVYVLKRPYVEEFLQKMGELYECVLFTASLGKYADPVTDLLDKFGVFRSRLFREACVYHRGNYVKDLSRLGRDMNRVIIVDNSPASYMFHPRHAVPVVSWFDDESDRELLDLIPFFEQLAKTDDIFSFILNANLPLGLANRSPPALTPPPALNPPATAGPPAAAIPNGAENNSAPAAAP